MVRRAPSPTRCAAPASRSRSAPDAIRAPAIGRELRPSGPKAMPGDAERPAVRFSIIRWAVSRTPHHRPRSRLRPARGSPREQPQHPAARAKVQRFHPLAALNAHDLHRAFGIDPAGPPSSRANSMLAPKRLASCVSLTGVGRACRPDVVGEQRRTGERKSRT